MINWVTSSAKFKTCKWTIHEKKNYIRKNFGNKISLNRHNITKPVSNLYLEARKQIDWTRLCTTQPDYQTAVTK